MWKYGFKAVSLTAAGFLMTGIAQANDRPIEILLSEVSLDLSNPDATAKRTIDKDFKSNDPTIRSRVYVLNDGTRVKLVGRNFDKVSDIDKVRVTYPKDEIAYKSTHAELTETFGAPSAKRPDVLVWRLENTTSSSTQSKTVKVIASINDAEKRTIVANRQRGGRGNNPRTIAPKTTFTPLDNNPRTQLRSSQRD